MNHHLLHILRAWEASCNSGNWVLGLISKTEGPAYRKTGSMMLLSDTGEQFGMLSGGCLESDLQIQAARTWQTQKPHTVRYDGNDEDNIMWQLGVGCGGRIEITLIPLNEHNNYLQLPTLRDNLSARRSCHYIVSLADGTARIGQTDELTVTSLVQGNLHIPIRPPPHLAVIGAGLDSQPLVDIALRLGWQVTVIEHRAARYKPHLFHTDAHFIYTESGEPPAELRRNIDACVISTHSVAADAKALRWIQTSSARYCGLLGPISRRQKVLTEASLSNAQLKIPVCGPAGLALGGDLPESVSLSILAECHAALHGASGQPLSDQSPL